MARRFLMGNEAFAHAALEAGCGLFAGYPGTPSSEVIETVARLLKDGSAHGIHVEWSTNEKAALEVAAAASLAGKRAMVTCKQVGLNVASDALMSLNYLGVRGGLVILVADDPGPISSQTEQDTRRFAAFAKVPVFDPATPEQGAEMIPAAFEMSERYGTPVIFRPTTRIDHASAFFDFPDETHARKLPEGGFKRDPEEYVIFPPRAFRAHGQINERLEDMTHDFMYDRQFSRFNPMFSSRMVERANLANTPDSPEPQDGEQPEAEVAPVAPEAKVGIVTGGVSTQYAREALRMLAEIARNAGVQLPPLRLLQIGTPYPFPDRVAAQALKNLTDVLVLEELDSVIEEELQKMASRKFLWPQIHGKLTGEANTRGENSTEDAVQRIAAFLEKTGNGTNVPRETFSDAEGIDTDPTSQDLGKRSLKSLAEQRFQEGALFEYPGKLAPRPAVLCAGCPHRASFLAIKRALKAMDIPRDDAIFCGDIGCYTLGNSAPLDAVDTCLCMGGGITMAQGFAAADPSKKAIAFVGDSTFFASGMTGIVNAAYNGHDVTICVLDNATTAMTGLQPHPGTGLTLMGEEREPVNIKGVLKAANISHIWTVDPLDPAAAEEAAAEALAFEGPSAIIFESACIWTKPFGIPAKVNSSKCIGCKKCITGTGCPAIGFDPNARGAKSGRRGQAVIDRGQCNGCGLCLPVCPVDAIDLTPEVEPQPVRQSRLNRPAPTETIGEPEDVRSDELELDPFQQEAVQPAVADDVRERAAVAAREHGLLDNAPHAGQPQPTVFSSKLDSIRQQMPIIPMNPFASVDEFEDDDLYLDMTARSKQGGRYTGEAARSVRRVIRPEGQRRFFMKEPIQRGAAAKVFAYTPSGEASRRAQLALTGATLSADELPMKVQEDAPEEAAAAEAPERKRRGPDYGGNSELSLDDLFSGSAEVDLPEDDPDEEPQEAAERTSSSRASIDLTDDGELELSFEGFQLEMEDDQPKAKLHRVNSSKPLGAPVPRKPAAPELDELEDIDELQDDLEPELQEEPAEEPVGKGATPSPRQQAAKKTVRSKFADYGRSPSSGGSHGPQNPWQGGRR